MSTTQAELDRLNANVEELRQKALDATLKETESRDTYIDGYASGLIEALRIVRRGE